MSAWFRVTLGESRGYRMWKWRHFHVESDGFDGALGKAREAFAATVGPARPAEFLCLRYAGASVDAVWKHGPRGWREVPLDEYLAERDGFLERSAGRRKAAEDSARARRDAEETRASQVAELRDAASGVLADACPRALERLAAAVSATAWAGGGAAVGMDEMKI